MRKVVRLVVVLLELCWRYYLLLEFIFYYHYELFLRTKIPLPVRMWPTELPPCDNDYTFNISTQLQKEVCPLRRKTVSHEFTKD